ncbi:MAG: M48 family metallopeptidase [Anaerovoracaceae bacterium]|jgi:predicted metal-dependent hydrolase
MVEYNLIRTNRKTLSIIIKPDGRVEVRAPLRASRAYIDSFVNSKTSWINSKLKELKQIRSQQRIIQLTPDEVQAYCKKALVYFQEKCSYYANKMGVEYEKIRVSKAKTRWGSCNSRGTLSFTYRLMFAREELIDYVIVHELAHRKEMNHSHRFWAVVEETLPDYKERRKALRDFEHQYDFRICHSDK